MPRKSRKPRSVREPVQVYLAVDDRALLDQVSAAAGISRAEALRRGIKRLAADVLGAEDPAHTFVAEMASAAWPTGTPRDLAARHDEYLTEDLRAGARRRRGR